MTGSGLLLEDGAATQPLPVPKPECAKAFEAVAIPLKERRFRSEQRISMLVLIVRRLPMFRNSR